MVARSLDWHVREQVEFNRHVMECVEATLEALNETKRVLATVAPAAAEMSDARSHWVQWRSEWEHKLFVNETQFLRSVADLQGAFQHRASLMEANFRDIARSQHKDYLGALERSTIEMQKKFWDEVAKARRDFERLIHEELRIVRQRAGQQAPQTVPAAPGAGSAHELSFDYGRFAERFRGTEDYVKKNIQFYLPRFQGCGPVLDIGCGRGEFLEMMRDARVEARGIDLSEEAVARCRQKGLQVDKADLFQYLNDLPDGSLGGIFCAQVIEHLAPETLPEMIRLASGKLSRDGLLVLETPNPECLAIFASHFYLDPTHTKPVPHPLAAFYMEECGLGQIEVQRLSPAVESMPALAGLPEDFREAFFGGLDYAIFAIKL
jgi:O-antigen chain-terminating methyltransferase